MLRLHIEKPLYNILVKQIAYLLLSICSPDLLLKVFPITQILVVA